MKVTSKKAAGNRGNSLGLSSFFFLCTCFFLAGFQAAILISQQETPRNAMPRIRRLVEAKGAEHHETLPHGDSGEEFVEAIPFQILSWRPRALYFPNFATAEQCKGIIKLAKPQLTPSKVALRLGQKAESVEGIRTSSGTFVYAADDKTGILDEVEEKIAKATMIPRTHGEAFNILHYEIGQHYESHYDAFDPAEYGPQKRQRVASFLLYLSDVEEGGETMFPYENGENMHSNYDYRECIGLKVKPRRGDSLLFYSLFPNGTIDPVSLHGSCPVIKGDKWVATKWLRDQDQEL